MPWYDVCLSDYDGPSAADELRHSRREAFHACPRADGAPCGECPACVEAEAEADAEAEAVGGEE